MALLDLAYLAGLDLFVAHVNYHKRTTADRDQQIVERYCQKRNIQYQTLHPIYSGHGNFQSWAREVRYAFFHRLQKEQAAICVLVAHHLDDLLETYLMQKQRGSIPFTWGISESVEIEGSLIVRPLLNMDKLQLMAYCESNQIDYGIDESNLSDRYQRNRIRHQCIETMSYKEKEALLRKIQLENQALQKQREALEKQLQGGLTMPVLLQAEEPEALLQYWIKDCAKIQLSKKAAANLLKQLKRERNLEIPLSDYVKLSKMYHQLEITARKDVSYCYVLDRIEMLSTPYFSIQNSGKSVEAVTLGAEDFPITIRNAQKADAIALRFGTKKVFRWFIDRKIPREVRKSWPVVVNCHGEIVLVPGIGCDVKHYSNNPTCFVVK